MITIILDRLVLQAQELSKPRTTDHGIGSGRVGQGAQDVEHLGRAGPLQACSMRSGVGASQVMQMSE